MELSDTWFTAPILIAAALVWLVLLAASARQAWCAVHADTWRTTAALLLGGFLWWLRIEVPAGHMHGMVYHLLGINLICLMLGAPAAFWLGSAYAVLYALIHGGSYVAAAPLTALLVVLPACAVNILLRRAALKLPENLFVYIFLNGFLGAGAGMLLTGLVSCTVLYAAGVFSGSIVWGSIFPVFFLLTWSEAFLSGIFTAIFAALRPQLLATFDDSRYLAKNNQIWRD